jgi:TolB-like protein/Tfp pilus assembly protein PilF
VPVFRRRPAEIEAEPVEAALAEQPQVKRPLVWLFVVAGTLCITGGLILWRSFSPKELSTSIAILPFTNLTSEPANQYFADGLTDEITDSLAGIKALRVIARSSAFQFKGKTVDVREVGRLLHVTNVLEGSVERSGDRIKIVAHLERALDRSVVWSNTYEREGSDLFAVQSELAAGIAGGLKLATAVPQVKHVPNAEAHDFFMKGRYAMQQGTPESMTQAGFDFQHAIDKDPEYAAAYVGLADAKYNQGIVKGSDYQTEAEFKGIGRSLAKALELDPGSPGANAAAAFQAMQYNRDWGLASREFQLAVAGPPNAPAESLYAFFLLFRGRFAEADVHFSRLADLDPFSTSTQTNLALARQMEGRFAEAREISQKEAVEHPNMLWPQEFIGFTYVEEGHPELALPVYRQLEQRHPAARIGEAMALAKAGRREEALRLIGPFEQNYANSGIPAEWLALVYAFMGDEPNTLKWLQRSADLHETQVLSLAVEPAFAPMRNSPGFRAIEQRIGLSR